MSETATKITTGEERLALVSPHNRHVISSVCPSCEANLNRVALIELAYVFTRCDCDLHDYDHLYEQLWHIACLRRDDSR